MSNDNDIQSLGGGDSALYPAPGRASTGESQPASDPGLPPPKTIDDNAAPYGNSPREIQKRAMKARTFAISPSNGEAP